jgi:hypothetical protein
MRLIAKYMDALEANEMAAERLYSIFADRFAGEGPFWGRLSKEERMHASILGLLMDEIETHDVTFSPHELDLDNINAMIRKANGVCEELEEGGTVDMKEALELAVKLEHGMLEHRFFDYFEGSGTSFLQDMAVLKKETEEHLKRITDKLDEVTMGNTNEESIDGDENE